MKNINEIIISAGQTLKAAMAQMTRSKKGVLLVLNDSNHLLGILSDGDVRRSILNESIMLSPVSQLMNTDPIVGYSVEHATELLKTKSLGLVPIVGKNRELKAIVVEEEGSEKIFEMQPKQAGDSSQSILIIIPARGGSKRIPHKNLQKVGGYSLLMRAISVAQEAFGEATIIVSTDDDQIAKEAQRMGVNIPWLRPPSLSTDNTGSFQVVEHALNWATSTLTGKINAVLLLEPTAPLRKAFHLTEAVDLFYSEGADSVVSVSEVPHVFHPEEILRVKDGKLSPYKEASKMHTRLLRGKQEKLYVQNGIVYVLKPEIVFEQGNLYGDNSVPYLVEWKYFADIDEPIDLITAEAKLKY